VAGSNSRVAVATNTGPLALDGDDWHIAPVTQFREGPGRAKKSVPSFSCHPHRRGHADDRVWPLALEGLADRKQSMFNYTYLGCREFAHSLIAFLIA